MLPNVDPNMPLTQGLFVNGIGQFARTLEQQARIVLSTEKPKKFSGSPDDPHTFRSFIEQIERISYSQKLAEREKLHLLFSACVGDAQNFMEKIKIQELADGRYRSYEEWVSLFAKRFSDDTLKKYSRLKMRTKTWDGSQSANSYLEEFEALFNKMQILNEPERISYILESVPRNQPLYGHLVASRAATTQDLKDVFIQITEGPDKEILMNLGQNQSNLISGNMNPGQGGNNSGQNTESSRSNNQNTSLNKNPGTE